MKSFLKRRLLHLEFEFTQQFIATDKPLNAALYFYILLKDYHMWLRTSSEMTFDITVPTPFILMLRLRSGAQQWVAREEYRLNPSVPVLEFTDNYGNLCQRLIAPAGAF